MKPMLLIILCAAMLTAGVVIFLPEQELVDNNSFMSTEKEAAVPVRPLSAQTPAEVSDFDQVLILRVLTGQGTKEMSLEEYLTGVLLAEMPAEFPLEALKAQSVASRTFALRQAQAGKHPGAHVCTDASCCQGWKDASEYDVGAVARVSQAVRETDGLVLTYGGALIEATFFSCSGGQTEAAVAVWGSDVPYLRSVVSPGEEQAEPYSKTVWIDRDSFARTLCAAYPEANLSGTPESWFGAVSYTEGGGIDTIFVGGVPVSGTSLRALFSLASTNITVVPTGEGVTVSTLGYGHRVGMSQYGAKAMAADGAEFSAILLHYYGGTEITQLLYQPVQHLMAQ